MDRPASAPLRRRFRCDASAPRLAREAGSKLDAIAPVRDDAALVVSELVTNAVRHSGCDEDDELELRVEMTPAGVKISARDVGRAPGAPRLRRRGTGTRGLGLHIVAAIAGRWGVEDEAGRRVWAEIALSSAARPGAPGAPPRNPG